MKTLLFFYFTRMRISNLHNILNICLIYYIYDRWRNFAPKFDQEHARPVLFVLSCMNKSNLHNIWLNTTYIMCGEILQNSSIKSMKDFFSCEKLVVFVFSCMNKCNLQNVLLHTTQVEKFCNKSSIKSMKNFLYCVYKQQYLELVDRQVWSDVWVTRVMCVVCVSNLSNLIPLHKTTSSGI